MRNFFKFLALGALFMPAVVLANGPEHRFTHQGAVYAYTVTADGHGRQVIEGRKLTDGSAFRLVVDGERVSGVSGGQPVAFRAPRAGGTVVAAR